MIWLPTFDDEDPAVIGVRTSRVGDGRWTMEDEMGFFLNMLTVQGGNAPGITCNASGCVANYFQGEPGDTAAHVRGKARAEGWICFNPGPGRPARDFCPDHADQAD